MSTNFQNFDIKEPKPIPTICVQGRSERETEHWSLSAFGREAGLSGGCWLDLVATASVNDYHCIWKQTCDSAPRLTFVSVPQDLNLGPRLHAEYSLWFEHELAPTERWSCGLLSAEAQTKRGSRLVSAATHVRFHAEHYAQTSRRQTERSLMQVRCKMCVTADLGASKMA